MEANPETNGLRRLLAVKKSLAEFEQNVELVSKVSISSLSSNNPFYFQIFTFFEKTLKAEVVYTYS